MSIFYCIFIRDCVFSLDVTKAFASSRDLIAYTRNECMNEREGIFKALCHYSIKSRSSWHYLCHLRRSDLFTIGSRTPTPDKLSRLCSLRVLQSHHIRTNKLNFNQLIASCVPRSASRQWLAMPRLQQKDIPLGTPTKLCGRNAFGDVYYKVNVSKCKKYCFYSFQ